MNNKDHVVVDFYDKDVEVRDEYGIKVIYEEAINDLLEIEEDLLKIGTFFINKHEFVFDSDLKEPHNAIDRGEVTLHLINLEHEF